MLAGIVRVLHRAVCEPRSGTAAAGTGRTELAARALFDLPGLHPDMLVFDPLEDCREVFAEDVADDELRPLRQVAGVDVSVPVDVDELVRHSADERRVRLRRAADLRVALP